MLATFCFVNIDIISFQNNISEEFFMFIQSWKQLSKSVVIHASQLMPKIPALALLLFFFTSAYSRVMDNLFRLVPSRVQIGSFWFIFRNFLVAPPKKGKNGVEIFSNVESWLIEWRHDPASVRALTTRLINRPRFSWAHTNNKYYSLYHIKVSKSPKEIPELQHKHPYKGGSRTKMAFTQARFGVFAGAGSGAV